MVFHFCCGTRENFTARVLLMGRAVYSLCYSRPLTCSMIAFFSNAQCCTDGAACKRRVCFFAHHESELRKPEDDPALLEAQLQAEALASEAFGIFELYYFENSTEDMVSALGSSHFLTA